MAIATNDDSPPCPTHHLPPHRTLMRVIVIAIIGALILATLSWPVSFVAPDKAARLPLAYAQQPLPTPTPKHPPTPTHTPTLTPTPTPTPTSTPAPTPTPASSNGGVHPHPTPVPTPMPLLPESGGTFPLEWAGVLSVLLVITAITGKWLLAKRE